MIKIENLVTPSPEQWKTIIMGARNPMNSWDRSDSYSTYIEDAETLETADYEFFIGDNDLDLLKRLSKAGKDHRKYLRMIPIYVDMTAPLYWWKEFDTYKIGTVANSCSTMHKIHNNPIEVSDFSIDDFEFTNADETMEYATDTFGRLISALEFLRQEYVKTNDKKYWRLLIQMLPSSYNQKRTVMLNYEVLANMYHSRKAHKLDEWRTLCEWIESLPYSELITGENENE